MNQVTIQPTNLQKVACPLCGADDFRLKYPATTPQESERSAEHFRCTSHHLASHGDIVQCNYCMMVYNNPQPDAEALTGIYKEVEDPLYVEETEARERTFAHSLKQLHRYIRPPGKMLEVGCYTGIFMKAAVEAGWTVEGIELSNWAAEIARGLEIGTVYDEPLDRLQLPVNHYDVIVMWDVIEHLAQPVRLLSDVHRLLKPGGVLAISTHLVDSMAVRIMGTRYPFFMDMHVVHFSRATIRRMLEEQGFHLLRIRSHRRILKTGYFLEKLYHKIPIGRSIIKWLSNRKWLANRFIAIGLLGLANIYANKK
jgi:2-polyprenyl-3-methyl-5-hydroxy-6-metoxy-1,4-benzoquinol methylase